MVRKAEPLCFQYNKLITTIYHKAINLIMDNYNSPLTIPKFKNQLFAKEALTEISFYDFIEQELELLKVDRAEGTIANYNKLINTLKVWKPTLEFEEITLDFIEHFHAYEIGQGNLESTVNKKHANFKFLIGRAVLKEKLAKIPMNVLR